MIIISGVELFFKLTKLVNERTIRKVNRKGPVMVRIDGGKCGSRWCRSCENYHGTWFKENVRVRQKKNKTKGQDKVQERVRV